jgi:hypothetical protein
MFTDSACHDYDCTMKQHERAHMELDWECCRRSAITTHHFTIYFEPEVGFFSFILLTIIYRYCMPPHHLTSGFQDQDDVVGTRMTVPLLSSCHHTPSPGRMEAPDTSLTVIVYRYQLLFTDTARHHYHEVRLESSSFFSSFLFLFP